MDATQYANAAQPALNQTYVPNQNIRAFIEKNGLSETDKEITEMTDKETRDVIEALLGRYRLEEQIDKVKEGFTAEKTAIQAAREALLGEIGY